MIFRLARHIGKGRLKTRSFGNRNNRRLTVSRKMDPSNFMHLASHVDSYRLFPPGTITVEDLEAERDEQFV